MRFTLFFLLLPAIALAQRSAPTPPAPAKPTIIRPATGRATAAGGAAGAATPGAPAPAAAKAPQLKGVAWSADRPLVITDFQGRPNPGEPHAALASSTIDARGACSNNVFTAEVRALFDPATSWVRDPATVTPALLRHEQLHFDIAELYARQLRLKLRSARPDCVQLQGAFNRLTRSVYTEWEQEEARYDQETNHGLNTIQQAVWERQTAVRLQQLAPYAAPETE